MLSIRTRLEERRGRAREASLIARADALVAERQAREAIELLDAAVHDHSAPEAEAHLLRIRHAAFASRDRAAGLSEWPPAAPDLFGVPAGSLPEVGPDDLSAAVIRSAIVNRGGLLVRGMLAPDRIERLVDAIDRAFAAHDAFYAGAPSTETLPWYLPFEGSFGKSIDMIRPFMRKGGGVLTVESPRTAREVIDTFSALGLIGMIGEHLGERPALSAKKWTLRKVPTTSNTNWHQDGAFLGPVVRSVNVWVTLSDCGIDAPGLDVVPRRVEEILPTGTEGAIFDWSIGEAVVARAAEGAPVVRPVLQAGDALVFDDRFVHRTAVDEQMHRERYAIESWFFAPSKYPMPQIPVML